MSDDISAVDLTMTECEVLMRRCDTEPHLIVVGRIMPDGRVVRTMLLRIPIQMWLRCSTLVWGQLWKR
jgi:hypothetical protein